jgi:polyphosphate kinase 2 (PPK2 family)
MKNVKTLSALLKKPSLFPHFEKEDEIYNRDLEKLQQKMFRIQQGVYHRKDRVIIVFEGFDAAGKGGTIKKITEMLDPRGFRVHPIGAPSKEEQGTHWLSRFWHKLPRPGNIAIFDRSWYGRVLVEKVDKLTPEKNLKHAYDEINDFESMLQNDGITLIKIFVAITKDEQLKRFDDRLSDPYKQWKISMDDVNARKKWNEYVKAVDAIFVKSNPKSAPWHVIPANSKKYTRLQALSIVTHELEDCERWMEKAAATYQTDKLRKLLKNS